MREFCTEVALASQRLEKLLDYQHEGVKRTREHLAYTVNGQLSTLRYASSLQYHVFVTDRCFSSCRMRNADIDTATDVFVTGEYQRLPKSIDVSLPLRGLHSRYDVLITRESFSINLSHKHTPIQ